jgi:hypothetical protein
MIAVGAEDATVSNGSSQVARISVATFGTDSPRPRRISHRSYGPLASVRGDHICHVELQELGQRTVRSWREAEGKTTVPVVALITSTQYRVRRGFYRCTLLLIGIQKRIILAPPYLARSWSALSFGLGRKIWINRFSAYPLPPANLPR